MTDKPEPGLQCPACWSIAWEDIDGELRCAACFYRDQAEHYQKRAEAAERQSASLSQTLDDVYKARDAIALRIERDQAVYENMLKGMKSQAEVGHTLKQENRELVKRVADLEALEIKLREGIMERANAYNSLMNRANDEIENLDCEAERLFRWLAESAGRVADLEPLLDRLADLLVSSDDGEVDCGACGAVLASRRHKREEHAVDCPVALAAALLGKE